MRILQKTLLLAVLMALTLQVRARKLLSSDTFETDSSAAWSVFQVSDSGTPDFTAQFSYLYTTNSYTSNGVSRPIPLAPNSATGAGRGVKLTVNKNDDVPDRSGVNIYLKNQSYSNNFSVQFDMWINYNGPAYGGTGSTEFAIFGINHTGVEVNWEPQATSPAQPDSDGIFFGVTGEGGAAGDYRSYEGNPGGSPLRIPGVDGGFLDRDGDGSAEVEAVTGTAALYPLDLIFPSPPYETKAVPGKRWNQVEIRQKDGVITWLMNGYVIAEKPNQSQWTSGTIMLGTMDPFASIASPKQDNFVLYDNVRISSLDATDEAARITLEATDPDAAEPKDPGTITFTRTGPTTSPLTVNFRYAGSATPGEDFGPKTNSVTIPAGAASTTLQITPIDDAKAEAKETVTVVLESGTGYEVAGSLFATVNLADDGDVIQVTATVQDPVAYEGIPDENGQILITRNGDPLADLTVNLTVSGTAPSTDYKPIPTSITIPAGSASLVVPVEPSVNFASKGDRTVIITVAPGSGYAPASPTSATVTIKKPGDLLFAEDFDGDHSDQYQVLTSSANNVQDYLALFSYDYSLDGLPAAPHSLLGTTRGLKLTVNKNDAVASAAAVNVFPKGKTFSGNYLVKFDMYLTYNPVAAGTTEHSAFGINHSGTITNRHDTAGSDGVWFTVETDASGTSGRSFTSYTTTNSTLKPVFTAKSFTGFTTAFPAPPALKAGTPSAQWSDVVISQENNLITWTINGIQIFQFTNSTPFTAGDIMLGYMDTFNSIGSTGNYVIYDNVKVYALSTNAVVPTVTFSKTVKVAGDGKATLAFSAPGGQASQFTIESAGKVSGPYTAETTAAVKETSAGQFEATLPLSGSARFYRIKL